MLAFHVIHSLMSICLPSTQRTSGSGIIMLVTNVWPWDSSNAVSLGCQRHNGFRIIVWGCCSLTPWLGAVLHLGSVRHWGQHRDGWGHSPYTNQERKTWGPYTGYNVFFMEILWTFSCHCNQRWLLIQNCFKPPNHAQHHHHQHPPTRPPPSPPPNPKYIITLLLYDHIKSYFTHLQHSNDCNVDTLS